MALGPSRGTSAIWHTQVVEKEPQAVSSKYFLIETEIVHADKNTRLQLTSYRDLSGIRNGYQQGALKPKQLFNSNTYFSLSLTKSIVMYYII